MKACHSFDQSLLVRHEDIGTSPMRDDIRNHQFGSFVKMYLTFAVIGENKKEPLKDFMISRDFTVLEIFQREWKTELFVDFLTIKTSRMTRLWECRRHIYDDDGDELL